MSLTWVKGNSLLIAYKSKIVVYSKWLQQPEIIHAFGNPLSKRAALQVNSPRMKSQSARYSSAAPPPAGAPLSEILHERNPSMGTDSPIEILK